MTSAPHLHLGFMPLLDCAPLVVAKEQGFFAAEGLSVHLMKQNAWATLRDKLHLGYLDLAQMLAPMPLASHLGLGVQAQAMRVPLVLSYNGNGISLSEALFDQVLTANQLDPAQVLGTAMSARLLQPVIQARRQASRPPLKFATVFAYSCHYYQLVSWLQQGGIAAADVDIQIIPPAAMVAAMEDGSIDGFCVGSPWNTAAVRLQLGVTVTTSYDIWPDAPEKVLGFTQAWQQRHPELVAPVVRALQRACAWLGHLPNRFEAARLLARKEYLAAPIDVVAPALLESCLTRFGASPRQVPRHNLFALEGTGNAPDPYAALDLLRHMRRCGHLPQALALQQVVDEVFDRHSDHQAGGPVPCEQP